MSKKRMTIAVAFLLGGAAAIGPVTSVAEEGDVLIGDYFQVAVGDVNGDGRFDVADVEAQVRMAEEAYGKGDFMPALRLFLSVAEPCRVRVEPDVLELDPLDDFLANDAGPIIGVRESSLCVRALEYLTRMYDRGLGVPQDSALASEWSEVARTLVLYTDNHGEQALAIPEGVGGPVDPGSALAP